MNLPKPLQNRWWIVFAAATGLAVGIGPTFIITFAVFLQPVSVEMGWSRATFSSALAVLSVVTVIAHPVFGSLVDRYGVKRSSLPMIGVMSLAIAAMGFMGPSLLVFYARYVVVGIGRVAQSPPMYSKAESKLKAPEGVAIAEALRAWPLWCMIVAFMLAAFAMHGILVRLIVLLNDCGWTAGQAVSVLAASGAAGVAGRIIGGFVLDRTQSSFLPALGMLLPAVGCVFLIGSTDTLPVMIAALLIGFGNGCEVDILSFFCSRYFGLKAYGQLLSICFAGFAAGVGLGLLFQVTVHGHTRSYDAGLRTDVVILLAVVLLLMSLGKYTYSKERDSNDASAGDLDSVERQAAGKQPPMLSA